MPTFCDQPKRSPLGRVAEQLVGQRELPDRARVVVTNS